jgi:hypothetical protein
MNIDLLTIVSDKVFCLPEWLDYIQTIPLYKYGNATWIIIDNARDEGFTKTLDDEISIRKLEEKFAKVIKIKGPGRFVPEDGSDWRDPKVCLGKHRSTGESFTLGFSLCSGDVTYTIDDDVIPPVDAFDKLMALMLVPTTGAAAGLYFNHSGWDTGNPWRTEAELKRTVVGSIRKDHWFPAMIDDFWGTGSVEFGFVGTGCTIWRTEEAKKCLPLESNVRDSKIGTILGPDGYLCEKLRERGKRIQVDSSILCAHREDTKFGEAGMGVYRFIMGQQATETAIIIGSYGGIDARFNTYRNVRPIAEKLDVKIVIAWPKNDLRGENCPWKADGRVAEIRVFDEKTECDKYKMIKDEWVRKKKALDNVYYEVLNSGKYKKVINLMRTTGNLKVEDGAFGENIKVTLQGVEIIK